MGINKTSRYFIGKTRRKNTSPVPSDLYLHLMRVQSATSADIPCLVTLINSAYRGDLSKKGWTTEAELLRGELRTDEANIKELMQSPGAVFLKYTDEQEVLQGCVFLQEKEMKLYLGMLSVSPLIQARGIGKQLMSSSIDHARLRGCHTIFMRVISIRSELINWYERQGYYKTGETEPFPDTPEFGIPVQPLEFIVLQKDL